MLLVYQLVSSLQQPGDVGRLYSGHHWIRRQVQEPAQTYRDSKRQSLTLKSVLLTMTLPISQMRKSRYREARRPMLTNLVRDQMGFHTKYAWLQSPHLVGTDKWTQRATPLPLR